MTCFPPEHQKENVWMHRGLLGRCQVDFAQLHYLQWRLVDEFHVDCSKHGKPLRFTASLETIHAFCVHTGNHKLTATAKVIVRICEHEVST